MKKILNILGKDIIVFDLRKRVVFCTSNLLKKLGYTLEEFIYENVITNGNNIKVLEGSFNGLKINLHTKQNKDISMVGKVTTDKWENTEAYYFIVEEDTDKKFSIKEYSCLLDSIPLFIWTKDLKDRYVYINEFFKREFSIVDENYIDKNKDILFAGKKKEKIDKITEEVKKNKNSKTHSFIINFNKKTKLYSIKIFPILGERGDVEYIGYIAIDSTIIMELENIELNKRKQIEDELENFMDVAVDTAIIADRNGEIKRLGLGCNNLLKWDCEEISSAGWKEFLHKDDYDRTMKAIDEGCASGKLIKIENRIIGKDGRYKNYAWRGKYLPDRNLFVATGRDITEENKLIKAKQKHEEAQKEEQIKNDFFANMSHEFKTPLNIILATLQLIEYKVNNNIIKVTPDEKFKEYMKSLKQNSYRLLRLSNNIIDLSRIDTGYYSLKLENKNIVEVVEDMVDSIADYLKYKNVQIIFDTEVEEMIVACDVLKIQRILLNLISNSVKYSKKDAIIKVNIHITNEVVISVKDNGIGISKENIRDIFNRFKQIDNTFTRRTEGAGIGLSIVKALVNMHGGRLWVNSEVEKGSEFSFSIPIRKVKQGKDVEANQTLWSEKHLIEFADIM